MAKDVSRKIQTVLEMFTVGQTILCNRCGDSHRVDEGCREKSL
ncbi:MAG: hypothetical protein QW318_08760 [Candidatus Caldarchaeum sp.]